MASCSRCKPITLPRASLAGDALRHRRQVCPLSSLSSLIPFRLSSDAKGLVRVRRSRSFGEKRVHGFFVMASGMSNEGGWRSVGTPLEPQSPEGQFLCGILKNQPHIFRVAASEQLKELALERESAFARWEHSVGSSEHSLHGGLAAKEGRGVHKPRRSKWGRGPHTRGRWATHAESLLTLREMCHRPQIELSSLAKSFYGDRNTNRPLDCWLLNIMLVKIDTGMHLSHKRAKLYESSLTKAWFVMPPFSWQMISDKKKNLNFNA